LESFKEMTVTQNLEICAKKFLSVPDALYASAEMVYNKYDAVTVCHRHYQGLSRDSTIQLLTRSRSGIAKVIN